MYTDFHDQNGNPVSASIVMEAIKDPIIRHDSFFNLFNANSQSPFTGLDEDDYIRESLIITNSCGSDGIKLGSVNIGMLKITVKNNKVASLQSPADLIDCRIIPRFEIRIDDNTIAGVTYKEYWVKEVEQLAEGVKLTCYDGMCKLDTPFSGALSGTPYQILIAAATACGVRVQSTQAEIEALPNGTKTFTLHEDNDCKTWRDVLSYLAQLMGCFVTFGRRAYRSYDLAGIEVRPFGGGASSFCDTITDSQRYTGAKFSLWDTAYAEFTLKSYALEDPQDPDSAKKQDFTYTDTTISTEGQTIDLGYNPFLQATTPETGLTQDQIAILHDLLAKVATYQYTPLQITLPVGFIYDLGDVIKCTGRFANTGFAGGAVDDAYGVILNETYTYGRDYRIKSLDSHAGKGRKMAPTAELNVTVVNGMNIITDVTPIVTATDGTNTYSATASEGTATLNIGANGTYTVKATFGEVEGCLTATVVIDSADTYTADVGLVNSRLNDNTWEVISLVSAAGLGSTYWNIATVKQVHLSGTIGTLDIDDTFYAVITDFNHNSSTEYEGISFMCFRALDWRQWGVALCDSYYGTQVSDGTKCFNINHWGGSNYGGWAACDMRYDILGSTDVPPSNYGSRKASGAVGYDPTATCASNPVPNTFMSCLPADLRAVMKPIRKYTDSYGGSSNVSSHVTATIDYLPLAAEFELFGARKYANQYEKNRQKVYPDNSGIPGVFRAARNQNDDGTGPLINWWERSACYFDASGFCYVNSGAERSTTMVNYSYGIAPMFMV